MKVKWGFKAAATPAPPNDRLRKLARRLDEIARKDENMVQRAREISGMRRQAALELHAVCGNFVHQLNALLMDTVLEFDPETYRPEHFHDDGVNLFQINARGRILQIEFESTAELTATENFRVPYILEGSARCFNQQLLDKQIIDEHALFYTVERARQLWRFFDARTYRTGLVDTGYLIGLMEQLV